MKLGRNDPCHCGSGQKYKKCHLPADEAARAAELAATNAAAAAAAATAAVEDPEGTEAARVAAAKVDLARQQAKTSKPALPAPAGRVARRRGVA